MGVMRDVTGVFRDSYPLGLGLDGVLRVGRTGFEVADTGDADFGDMVDRVESDDTVERTDEAGEAEGMMSRVTWRPPTCEAIDPNEGLEGRYLRDRRLGRGSKREKRDEGSVNLL